MLDIGVARGVVEDVGLPRESRILDFTAAVQQHAMPEEHISLLGDKQTTFVLGRKFLRVFAIGFICLAAGGSQIGLRIVGKTVEKRLAM